MNSVIEQNDNSKIQNNYATFLSTIVWEIRKKGSALMLIWKEVWVIVYVIDSFEIHHLLWHLFNRHAHLLPSFLSPSLSLSHYLFFLWNATAHSNRPTAFALRSFTLAPLLLYSRAYKETVAYNSVKKFVSPSTNFTSEQIRSLFPGFSDGFSFSSPLPFPFSLFFFFIFLSRNGMFARGCCAS